MKIFTLYIFVSLILLLTHTFPLAAAPSNEEIVSKIEECLKEKNPIAITEYTCIPNGDFIMQTGKQITELDRAYYVIISMKMNDVDTRIMQFMQSLQSRRETDPAVWDNLRTLGLEPLIQEYSTICSIGTINTIFGLWKKGAPIASNEWVANQSFCTERTNLKEKAWRNMFQILQTRYSAKGFENDKSMYMSKLKGKYGTLLDKWQLYQRTMDMAVRKFTYYIRNPVR